MKALLSWRESLGWVVKHGADVGPGTLLTERGDYREVLLAQRLRDALARRDAKLPEGGPRSPHGTPAYHYSLP